MRIIIHENMITLKGLSSGYMLTCSVIMAFILFLGIIFIWPVFNSDAITYLGKSVYLLIVLVILVGQIGVMQVYRSSRESICEINRSKNEMTLRFGKKEVCLDMGEFKHILIQSVKTRRHYYQQCAVLVGRKNEAYLHICDSSSSGLEKQVEVVAEFLNIAILESSEFMRASEFYKRYP